ncbi:hypothetical protein GGI01_001853 [Coemansia sp. RSA 376]|nr:hypothetical protein GGH13_007336 [Coemansia sp. S155-1]KAJ2262011.1 hypothetical protein GGI01_001853 [Coemansia sp. RSA 376]
MDDDSITSAIVAAVAASDAAISGLQPKPEPNSHQPRYLTRSVAQNAAKRKLDSLTSCQPKQQRTTQAGGGAEAAAFQPLPAASQLIATARLHNPVNTAEAALTATSHVNPYYMMVSGDQQQQQQQPVTWSSAVLYQAARAAVAAGAGPSPAVPRATRQKAAAQQQQNPPAPKRRKNAAAATTTAAKPAAPRAARGRAAPRTKQQALQLSLAMSVKQ